MKKYIITNSLILLVILVTFFLKLKNDESLGDSYYYLPKHEAIDIGFPEGAIIYKSSQKYVFNDIKISKEVVEVNFNENFILAVQLTKNYTFKEKVLNYYIIEKKTDIVYGPFTKEKRAKCYRKINFKI